MKVCQAKNTLLADQEDFLQLHLKKLKIKIVLFFLNFFFTTLVFLFLYIKRGEEVDKKRKRKIFENKEEIISH